MENISKSETEIEESKTETSDTKEIIGKVITVVATAYTAGVESTGKKPGEQGYRISASGLPVDIGMIATDPEVIPLGTIVYIPNYGYAIAADKGGKIKGNRIDVFFHDLDKAKEWVIKEVNIVIVGKIENFPRYWRDFPINPYK